MDNIPTLGWALAALTLGAVAWVASNPNAKKPETRVCVTGCAAFLAAALCLASFTRDLSPERIPFEAAQEEEHMLDWTHNRKTGEFVGRDTRAGVVVVVREAHNGWVWEGFRAGAAAKAKGGRARETTDAAMREADAWAAKSSSVPTATDHTLTPYEQNHWMKTLGKAPARRTSQ